jgi:hypothetical protein
MKGLGAYFANPGLSDVVEFWLELSIMWHTAINQWTDGLITLFLLFGNELDSLNQMFLF